MRLDSYILSIIKTREFWFFLVTAIFLYWITPSDNPFNGPIRIANQILEGKLYLPYKIGYIESFTYNGNWYIAYPPLVSAVLVPFVFFLRQLAISGFTPYKSLKKKILIILVTLSILINLYAVFLSIYYPKLAFL